MKRPECFSDLLELQNTLDNNIHNTRERTDNDIMLSAIAEIIEWNEETIYSHKTWKNKEIKQDVVFEEMIDILFFVLQYINWERKHKIGTYNRMIAAYKREFDDFKALFKADDNWYKYGILALIKKATDKDINGMLCVLKNLFISIGKTKEDVLDGYYKKWQKNMKRIGTEWN